MFKIKCFDKIAACGLKRFGDNYVFTDDITACDGVMVRSSSLRETPYTSALAVARAGAGVNNIPVDEYTRKGIVVFNTPGANANAVKELVIAALLLGSRDIVGGVNWVKTLDGDIAKAVEKGKKAFAGNEIKGKKLGVIGLGAIGVLVANSAIALGMTVYGYDPNLSIEHALELSTKLVLAKTPDALYSECDYITVHVPLVDSTKHMLDAQAFSKMKKNVIILNFSRDALVDDDALLAAISEGRVARYLTDFPNEKTARADKVVAIPHLGASTEESEDNCAVMAADELKKYLETGNIDNSVNFPSVDAGGFTAFRIAVLHKNVPNMIGQFTAVLGADAINITNMVNKCKGDSAYTVIDTETDPAAAAEKFCKISNIYKVRVIKQSV